MAGLFSLVTDLLAGGRFILTGLCEVLWLWARPRLVAGQHPFSFTPQLPLPRGNLCVLEAAPRPISALQQWPWPAALLSACSGQWGGRDKQWGHNEPVFLSLCGLVRNKARNPLSREKPLQLRDLGHHEALGEWPATLSLQERKNMHRRNRGLSEQSWRSLR